jgi:hypothetical protein
VFLPASGIHLGLRCKEKAMSKFKVGDVVRCIGGVGLRLTAGELYTVIARNVSCSNFIDVIGEGERWAHGGWMPSRFELVSSSQHPKTKTSNLTGMAQFYKERGM